MMSNGASKTDLTLLINAHREGQVLAHTMRSARLAIKKAEAEGYRCELLLVFDRSDETTRTVAESCREPSDIMLQCDVGNAGEARNFGVLHARGRAIALLDGDDLIGSDWLARAFAFLDQCGFGEVCLHPACTLIYGEEKSLWRHIGMDHPDFRFQHAMFENYFTALSFASTELYKRIPFQADLFHLGFGHEDFAWVQETMHRGVKHLVVPETIHAVRRRRSSRLVRSRSERHLTIPTALFSGRDIRLD